MAKKRNIVDFAGVFKDNKKEWEEIEQKIYEDRNKAKLRNTSL